jgi:hypothetical protein
MYLWAAKAIAGSLLGAATSTYIKKTKLGKWLYKKYESIVAWAADRYGIDILNKEEVKLQERYPLLLKQIKNLENRVNNLEGKK